MKNEIPYFPPEVRNNPEDQKLRADAIQQVWQALQKKWGAIPRGRALLIDDNYPIGYWRKVVEEVHGIHLPE